MSGQERSSSAASGPNSLTELEIILQRYGLAPPVPNKPVLFGDVSVDAGLPGVSTFTGCAGEFLYDATSKKHHPAFRTLLPYSAYEGADIEAVWVDSQGRAVLGILRSQGGRVPLVGLDVVEEWVRCTHGNPARVTEHIDKTMWGKGGHERPAYLYEENLVPNHELAPWADHLGFTLAGLLGAEWNRPLLAPLPGGARGAILVTGDDDEAFLQKYDEQLRLLDGLPVTYMLLTTTRHTQQTLAALPKNAEFGLHVDALEYPDRYASACTEQAAQIRKLAGARVRSVRNHGHLNAGYLGHLDTWESCGLVLDLNIRGIDGTCPTGSYLPFRIRRPDGSWSSHFSLFSTFSDSMGPYQGWSERKQVKCIMRLADQIESTYPGVLVFNLHPQNVSSVRKVHRAVKRLASRRCWATINAEELIDWILAFNKVRAIDRDGNVLLEVPNSIASTLWVGSKGAVGDVLELVEQRDSTVLFRAPS